MRRGGGAGGGAAGQPRHQRTLFTAEQITRLQAEFALDRYLSAARRGALAAELNLTLTQVKIWFQNKRAKVKKGSDQKGGLAVALASQGIYNH